MKKYIVALVLLFALVASPAYAMTAPIFGPLDDNMSASATEYYNFEAGASSFMSTIEADSQQPVAIPGVVSKLNMYLESAPGTGTSFTVTLFKNNTSTALTCTIANSNQSCADTVHTVTVAANDQLAWQVTPSGTPAINGIAISSAFDGTNAGEAPITGGNTAAPGSATQYFSPFGSIAGSEAAVATIMPTSGTLDNLYADADVPPIGSFVYTLFKNGVATNLTCTMTGSSQTSCTDTNAAHAVSFVAGDTFSMQTQGISATTYRPVWSMRWKPTIDGEYPLVVNESSFSPGSGKFESIFGPGNRESSDAFAQTPVPAGFTLKKFYYTVSTAPGGSASWNLVSRKNGVTQTITGTLTGAVTSTNDLVDSDTYAAGDFINYLINPTNTPATPSYMDFSAVSFIQPPIITPTSVSSKFRIYGGRFSIKGGKITFR